MDHDEDDRERPIPVGSMGLIWRLNHVDKTGQQHFDIAWDNGAWTVYSELEINQDLQMAES